MNVSGETAREVLGDVKCVQFVLELGASWLVISASREGQAVCCSGGCGAAVSWQLCRPPLSPRLSALLSIDIRVLFKLLYLPNAPYSLRKTLFHRSHQTFGTQTSLQRSRVLFKIELIEI